MDDAKKAQYYEAFEILGKKAPTIDKDMMGTVMRSMGLNPSEWLPVPRP